MRKQHIAWIGAIAAVAVAMSGCSSTVGDSDTQRADANGGTLTYLESQTWNTLYPPSGGFYPNGGVINQITDRLLYQDPETLELEPWIATELPEVNADATEYTFTLREDVTYSDGTPLDAENVVKNFDLYGLGDADRALTVSEAINNYDHGEIIDDHTVKFVFSAPSPGFGQAVSTINSGLVSNSTLDRTSEGFGPGNATEIIGSGPFVITDEQIGKEISFEARADYDWAPPSHEHQGRAELDAIKLVVAGEASVRVGTVVAGQADIARQIPAPDEAQFQAGGLELHAASTNGVVNGLNFRFAHPYLEDVRVRQAIIAGINREEILSTLFTDSYPLATGVLAKTALGYLDTSEYYAFDLERAAELLDDAGWTLGSDGMRVKDGEVLALTFNEALPQPRSKEVVTLIQDQLAKLGIRVSQYTGDQAAQDQARLDIEEIQVYHSMVGRSDYDVIKSQFSGENRNALLNRGSDGVIHDQILEDLLTKVASVPTADARAEASAEVQQRIAEQAYVLPLFEEPQVFGFNTRVHGFATESIGRPSFYGVSLSK